MYPENPLATSNRQPGNLRTEKTEMAYDPKKVAEHIEALAVMAQGMTDRQADNLKGDFGRAIGRAMVLRTQAAADKRQAALTESFEKFLINRRFASVSELAVHLFEDDTPYSKQRTYAILNPLAEAGTVARFKARDDDGAKLGPRWRHKDSRRSIDAEQHAKLFPGAKRRRAL
jgi:hypothetical protein